MKTVRLRERFGSNIFTRKTISVFFEEISLLKDKEVLFDFKDVEFISRSCADEYLKQKSKMNKKIIEVNVSDNVRSMFRIVQNHYERAGLTISFIQPSKKGKELLA